MAVSPCAVIRSVWCAVSRSVLGLRCPGFFLIRFTYSVSNFIFWLFGTMANSENTVRHGELFPSIREDDHKDDCEETGEVGVANIQQEVDPATHESSFISQRNPYAVKDMQTFRQKSEVGVANIQQEVDPATHESSFISQRNPYAVKDMQTFRQKSEETFEKLKELTDDDMADGEDLPNLQFYRNNKKFTPGGVFIEDFHSNWLGDYNRLEYVHTYIQWLFPIQEKGMNYESHILSLKEIKHFHQDEEVKQRLLVSYKLMLDFYGMKLVDDKTGKVARAENWSHRVKNLNRNSHNNLRITRILKCLGLLGFGGYQAPLVRFFLEETLVRGTLPRVKQSALDYFIFAVLDKTEREELIRFAVGPSKRKEMANYGENYRPNKGQSNQKDWLKSRVQNKDEIGSDAKKDTSNDQSLSSESRNDENVSGVCQESDTQALPILTAGKANTADTNKDPETPSCVSLHVASVQEDESKAGMNEISNTEQEASENLDATGKDNAALAERSKDQSDDKNLNESTDKTPKTSDHSTTDNVANETPLSGISGSELQDRGDKSDHGNNNEPISQLSDTESNEETQQRDSESPEDSVATGSSTNHEGTSAHFDADTNSHKVTESDANILRIPHGASEQQNLDDKLDASKKEENEKVSDPVNHGCFTEENLKDRLIDACVSNAVTSNNDGNSDSQDVLDGDDTEPEQASADRSGVNSSQGILGKDSETEEGSKDCVSIMEEHTEIGCVRGGGSDTADTNKDPETPSCVSLQVASVQEDESKAGMNEISNTEQEASENLDATGKDNAALAERSKDQSDDKNLNESTDKTPKTSDHSTTDNVANETPLSGISGSELQDRGDKSDHGNNNEPISQLSDTESNEETQQRDSESPEDSVATGSSTNHEGTSAHFDADTNSHKVTESDANILRNPHGASEQQNLDDKLDASKKEENEKVSDPVNHGCFTEENLKDRLIDACVSNAVTSNNDGNSDSQDVLDGDDTEPEQASADRSGVNSSQGILGKDSETEEGSKDCVSIMEEHTEIGCVRGGGSEKEEND